MIRFPLFPDSTVPDTGGSASSLRKLSAWGIRRLVFLSLLTFALFFFALNAAAQPTRRVLILTGSDPNHPGFSIITRNIRATLRDISGSRIELLYELQQGLLDPSDSQNGDAELAGYLRQKYDDKHIDLVLVMVASRFRILLQKDPGLFRDIPKIFYDFDTEREETNRSLGPNITGVWAGLDLHKTLDLAFALHPNTGKVLVLSGNSSTDKLIRDRAKTEFRNYETRAEFTYFTGDTIEDLKGQVANLGEGSIVIFLAFTSDKAGNRYSGPEALSMIAPVSKAPIYGYSDTLMGFGITGGNLLDFEAMGKRIGAMSLRVLAGERPEGIPQETAPTVMTVDWRELQRWGISEQALPPGSVVRFREPSFWEIYKWYIFGLTTACILEALLIAWLLFMRARRRQAERESERLTIAVAEEHRRLNEVVSNVPGVVWEARIDALTGIRKPTFVSEYIEEMLGYSQEEFLSSPGFGLKQIHERDRERVIRETETLLAGKGGSVQFRWVAKDGNVVWAEAQMSPIVDEAGKTIGVRGVTLDITGQKISEVARRESQERNRAILQAIPDPMFLQTRDGVFLDYQTQQGDDELIPDEGLLGRNMSDVFPPEVTAEFSARFEHADKEATQVFEYPLPVNGSNRWYEARIVQSGANVLSLVRDITSRKSSEEALRQSEERFRNMADTAPVMIWVADANRLRTYTNKKWIEFTGRKLEHELGMAWAEGIHPDDQSSFLEAFALACDRREPFRMEYRLRHKDGDYRWVFDTGTPRFSSNEEFLGFIGSCIDITARKESEEKLRRAHDELNQMKNQLEEENIYLQEELLLGQSFGEIVGQSDAIKYVHFKISEVAPTDTTVLIMGDTGTGKELAARAIHERSSRNGRPLIKVNCAALSASLIESELFGHEKGAFTGAGARRLGRFELANGGTIFLDEIGELPLELQVKLLRVIQEAEFERLGGTKTIKVDVRIIAATNRNLKAEVEKETFRQDLWYRLNVFPITMPPLKHRKEDIPLLVDHFVAKWSKKFGKEITSVSANVMRSLQEHSWPGNVRELANVIERSVIHTHGSVLNVVDRFEQASKEPSSQLRSLEDMEREHITRTLEYTGWRIEGANGAAKILDLNPSTLRARMAKLQIQRPRATHA